MTGAPPSPERARLVTALRELKQRTGLSLMGLADRTPYSKSSWDRYLNGKALPPRQAVRALCRLAGEQDGRCLALWEIAEAEASGRAAVLPRTDTPPPDADPGPAPAPAPAGSPPARDRARRGGAVVALLASVCVAALGGLGAAVLLLPGGDDDRKPASSSSVSPPGHRCRGAVCEGRNPVHMTCGIGPDTLSAHRTATGAWLELRYSAACRAGWARTWGTSIGDRIEVIANGRTRSAEVMDETDAEAYVYTAMIAVHPGAVVRACFRPGTGGERECFDSRAERGRWPGGRGRSPGP